MFVIVVRCEKLHIFTYIAKLINELIAICYNIMMNRIQNKHLGIKLEIICTCHYFITKHILLGLYVTNHAKKNYVILRIRR